MYASELSSNIIERCRRLSRSTPTVVIGVVAEAESAVDPVHGLVGLVRVILGSRNVCPRGNRVGMVAG